MHTPSFRYHDLPYQDCLNKVGAVTLQDYRDDLVALIESLNQPLLLLGHSLGFLVAQMAAKKIDPSIFFVESSITVHFISDMGSS